jgi:hypothetical protein
MPLLSELYLQGAAGGKPPGVPWRIVPQIREACKSHRPASIRRARYPQRSRRVRPARPDPATSPGPGPKRRLRREHRRPDRAIPGIAGLPFRGAIKRGHRPVPHVRRSDIDSTRAEHASTILLVPPSTAVGHLELLVNRSISKEMVLGCELATAVELPPRCLSAADCAYRVLTYRCGITVTSRDISKSDAVRPAGYVANWSGASPDSRKKRGKEECRQHRWAEPGHRLDKGICGLRPSPCMV